MPKRPSPSKRKDPELPPLRSPLESAIEAERSRLARARAVLGCLQVALLYSGQDGDDPDVGDFSDAADVARGLVAESIERLDSANIGPLMKKLRNRQYAEPYLSRRLESGRWALASLNSSGFDA